MLEQRIGQAQIALGIFKVNGVDLVRHGAGANFAVFQALLEVTHADIAPNVARPVNQNGVGAGHGIKDLGHVVMRLDLNAVGLKGQPESQWLGRFNDFAAKRFPVKVWPGRQMRVVVANGPIHLRHQRYCRNFCAGRHQSNHDIGNFFANGGGAGCLAVGAAQHGLIGMAMRHLAHLGNYFVECGQQHAFAAAFKLQSVAGVVDVFTGAGEMHKLTNALQFWASFKFGLDPIFNRLDIMIGGFFNFFDGQCVDR